MLRTLDESTVRKVRTGAVLPCAATAVKELLENALDAGASVVRVRFVDDVFHFEVADDGCGIAESDWPHVCRAHTTSKLTTFDDLASVRTLGFRGEALNALCAHARVTLLTRADASSPIAVLAYDERGELQRSATRDSDARLPRTGTVVCVDNLFGAMPVRAAVLREQQARQCATLDRLFLHYGLLYPRVDMRFDFTPLAGGGRLVFKGAVASLNDAVSLQFGSKLRDDLDSFSIEHEDFRAQLLVPCAAPSAPTGVMRGTSDHMFLSVNGRPIVCQPLSQTLSAHYRRHFQEPRRFPFVVCDIQCEPALVDINVTPDKRQVHFSFLATMITKLTDELASRQQQTADEQSLPLTPVPSSSTTTMRQSTFGEFVFGADQTRQTRQLPRGAPTTVTAAAAAAEPEALALFPEKNQFDIDVQFTMDSSERRMASHNRFVRGAGVANKFDSSQSPQFVGLLDKFDERRGCDGAVAVVRHASALFAVSVSRARETIQFDSLCANESVPQQELACPISLLPNMLPDALWSVVERRHEPTIARVLQLNGFALSADDSPPQLTHVPLRKSSAVAPLTALIELLRLTIESVQQPRTESCLRSFRAACLNNDSFDNNERSVINALLDAHPDCLQTDKKCPHNAVLICALFQLKQHHQ
jgi:DNA mismatch repair protein PMS2